MYGTCLVLCYGFRAATEMDALTHGDTEVKRNTGGEKYFGSFYLFCNQINVFLLSLEMATGPCKEKDPPIRSEILSLLVLFLSPPTVVVSLL